MRGISAMIPNELSFSCNGDRDLDLQCPSYGPYQKKQGIRAIMCGTCEVEEDFGSCSCIIMTSPGDVWKTTSCVGRDQRFQTYADRWSIYE